VIERFSDFRIPPLKRLTVALDTLETEGNGLLTLGPLRDPGSGITQSLNPIQRLDVFFEIAMACLGQVMVVHPGDEV